VGFHQRRHAVFGHSSPVGDTGDVDVQPDLSLTHGTITLRPLGLEDVQAHYAAEDAELARWLNGGRGTLETVRAHIMRTMGWWEDGGPIFGFGVRLVADDTLVGTIDVQLHQPYLGERQANLAYGIYPAWRKQGLATRAVVVACEFLRRRVDVDEAVIRTEPDNPASAAVARRAGFVFSQHADDEHGRYDWYVLPLRRMVK
jgi:RimJ/RimL family protein N-acetyltransferase